MRCLNCENGENGNCTVDLDMCIRLVSNESPGSSEEAINNYAKSLYKMHKKSGESPEFLWVNWDEYLHLAR